MTVNLDFEGIGRDNKHNSGMYFSERSEDKSERNIWRRRQQKDLCIVIDPRYENKVTDAS